jgi:hypothetical protein
VKEARYRCANRPKWVGSEVATGFGPAWTPRFPTSYLYFFGGCVVCQKAKHTVANFIRTEQSTAQRDFFGEFSMTSLLEQTFAYKRVPKRFLVTAVASKFQRHSHCPSCDKYQGPVTGAVPASRT